MSPPRLSAAHADGPASKKDIAIIRASLAKEVRPFHRTGSIMRGPALIMGRYRMIARLPPGGMSLLYAARDVVDGKPVVVKIAKTRRTIPRTGPGPEICARALHREGIALSRARHRNIVRLRSKALSSKRNIIVLDFVPGIDLQRILAVKQRLSWRATREIALQLCDALQTVHDSRIIHRDIKPENIIISRHKGIKATLLDFGLARLDASHENPGPVLGTLPYMAPELLTSLSYDHRADIYGVGVLMYEMLTGRNPFEAENDYATRAYIRSDMPRPPSSLADLPPHADYLVMRALSKDPKDRFESMLHMKDVLCIRSCR